MKTNFVLTLISVLLFQVCFSQVALGDIEKSINISTDEYVEHLLSKKFIIKYHDNKSFTNILFAYPTLKGDLLIDYFKTDKGISCDFQFYKKYNVNFLLLESAIKKKYKKINFFYSNDYHHYVTEYKIGEYYIFIGRKPLFDDSFQKVDDYGIIYVSSYYSEFH